MTHEHWLFNVFKIPFQVSVVVKFQQLCHKQYRTALVLHLIVLR